MKWQIDVFLAKTEFRNTDTYLVRVSGTHDKSIVVEVKGNSVSFGEFKVCCHHVCFHWNPIRHIHHQQNSELLIAAGYKLVFRGEDEASKTLPV